MPRGAGGFDGAPGRPYPGLVAWVLFIDESGHDRKASPYVVLAGIAVRDRGLWPMIGALRSQHRSRPERAPGA